MTIRSFPPTFSSRQRYPEQDHPTSAHRRPQTTGRNHGRALARLAEAVTLIAMLFAPLTTRATIPADGMLIDRVWSGHPVSFALLTERGHQFIAYYDAERRLTVAGRALDQTHWTYVKPEGVPVPNRHRLSNVTGWDSHNSLVLALDRDGCLHLSGNMHADPLVYYRTTKPFDLTTLERIDRMTGEREQRATYPGFLKSANGDLLFKYRDGGSGNGSDLYNIYDSATRTWRRLFEGPLLDGENERSAYGTGPRRGPDGLYHMVWMWRDTPDAMTNHTLSYARSRDLLNWETSAGKPVPRPLTMANAEVIDPAKPGGGLINMCFALGWDDQKRPVVAYHRYDAAGLSQIFVARADGQGHWQVRQISDWGFRWEFPGQGSQVKQVSVGSPAPDGSGGLWVDFSQQKAGAGRWRLSSATLAVLEQLPAPPPTFPEESRPPHGDYPGLTVQTLSSRAEDRRWLLRWETLPPNRDLADRPSPPPSELLLFETTDPESPSPHGK
jgi:hypothetical protein